MLVLRLMLCIGINGLLYVCYYDFNYFIRDGNGRNVGMIMRENDDWLSVLGCKLV